MKDAFIKITKSIMDSPALMPPNFIKDFILDTFTTDVYYATMLTQKNAQDVEIPVSFLSSTFKGDELNYT